MEFHIFKGKIVHMINNILIFIWNNMFLKEDLVLNKYLDSTA